MIMVKYTNPSGNGIDTDPEGDPREDDDEDRGNIQLDHVVPDVSLQDKVDF